MQTDKTIPLRQVRDVGDVINETFQFLRQNYETLGKSLVFIVGPVMVLSSAAGTAMQFTSFSLSADGATDAETTSALISMMGSLGLVMVFSLVGSVLSIVVTQGFVMLYEDAGPGRLEVSDVWEMTKARFWKIFGSLLVLLLVFMVPIVIVIIPCLGAAAYFVGAVYFGVAFSLLFPMMLSEDVGLFEGMRRCMDLVKGYWWQTLGVLLLSGIIYAILSSLVSMPYYVMIFVYGLNSIDGGGVGATYTLFLALSSLIAALGTVLLYSIPLTATVFHYFNLVERKERPGLMAQIDALRDEADAARSDPPPFSPGDADA